MNHRQIAPRLSGDPCGGALRNRRRRTIAVVLWMAFACCITAQRGLAAVDDDTAVEGARGALEQWVQTRQVLSKERSEWALGRELLQERVDLVRREVVSLRERVTEARESLAEAELKKEELLEEQARLQLASTELVATADVLESRTLQLVERLPEPIEERVAPLSQRLPEPETETSLSLSERFQNVVGILNAVNKFNRDMTVTSEVRTLADGTSAEVATLYAGLGQAWYCSGNGLAAGVGSSTAEGWVWRPATEAAAAIQRAIAILENEVVAEFVQLPVQVD